MNSFPCKLVPLQVPLILLAEKLEPVNETCSRVSEMGHENTRIFFFIQVLQSAHTYTQWTPPSHWTLTFFLHARRFLFLFLRVAKHKGNQWEKMCFLCWMKTFFFIVVDDQHFEVCSVPSARHLLMSVFDLIGGQNLMCGRWHWKSYRASVLHKHNLCHWN